MRNINQEKYLKQIMSATPEQIKQLEKDAGMSIDEIIKKVQHNIMLQKYSVCYMTRKYRNKIIKAKKISEEERVLYEKYSHMFMDDVIKIAMVYNLIEEGKKCPYKMREVIIETLVQMGAAEKVNGKVEKRMSMLIENAITRYGTKN